jgi:hypothetical protein
MSKEIIGKFGYGIQVEVTSHIIITTDNDGLKQDVLLHDNQAEELIAQLQEAIVRYREVRKSWEEGK